MFLEKAKEHEKQREEEYYKKNGCPVQHAETKFFETTELISIQHHLLLKNDTTFDKCLRKSHSVLEM